jgi:hypothetical protein
MSYQISVFTHFRYQDEPPDLDRQTFETYPEAVAYCQGIIDETLARHHVPGMTGGDLFDSYTSFEDAPSIIGPPVRPPFAAWDYANKRSQQICESRSYQASHEN